MAESQGRRVGGARGGWLSLESGGGWLRVREGEWVGQEEGG